MQPKGNYTDKQIGEILESYQWTFAKTYATKSPHWWSHRKTSGDPDLFQEVARYIFHCGETIPYYRLTYPCFTWNGYRYWYENSRASDAAVDATPLINRTLVDIDELERVVNSLGYDWTGKADHLKAIRQNTGFRPEPPPLF